MYHKITIIQLEWKCCLGEKCGSQASYFISSFFLKDCQTLLSLLSDGFERLALISSENSSAENQPNLINLHHEYYSPELSISQESTQILEKDLAQVESLIDYFEKSKNKQRICKE